jgi:dTDP-4-dehydrorhamnose reductase
MKVLLFGASGQLGRALVTARPPNVVLKTPTRLDCDLGDELALQSLIRGEAADVVINAAGYTRVDEAEGNPDLAQRVNALAAGAIAAATRVAGGRTVHISTDFVFDGLKSTPYKPDDPPAPLNQYGKSKWNGEQAVNAADPAALIVRTAWLYDSGPSNFIGTILRLASARNRLKIVDDQIGTPTSAQSLATAVWGLIHARARGIHHFTDAGVASWYDFAFAIAADARAFGLLDRQVIIEPIPTQQYPTPALRPAYSVLDKGSTWAILGWKSPHWRDGLRTALSEVRQVV